MTRENPVRRVLRLRMMAVALAAHIMPAARAHADGASPRPEHGPSFKLSHDVRTIGVGDGIIALRFRLHREKAH